MKKLLIVILILFLAPFVSADWYWNAFTQRLDYYEPVSGADLGDLDNVVFTLSATGNLIYYNGTNWVNLATGTNGQILHLAAGIPSWITAITPNHGGTGLIGYAIGDLIYADGATSLARLADVALGQVLTSGGVGVAPSWSGTPSVLTLDVNYGGATGESGVIFNSINNTFSLIAQSDAEGIGNSSDLRIGLDPTMRTLIICEREDIGTDFGFTAQTYPSIFIVHPSLSAALRINATGITGMTGTNSLALNFSGRGLTNTLQADVSEGNVVSYVSTANRGLSSGDGQQAWMYYEPKSEMTAQGAFNAQHINLFAGNTYGDGSTGDGNNFVRWSDDGTTVYKFNLTGAYHFLETTTPTGVTNYGALYTKDDNLLYFQDGEGSEKVVALEAKFIAEMYMYESGGTITIDTTDEYHLMSGFSTGTIAGWTFDAGSTGPIASFADYSGTVANTILVTDNDHGLVTGDDVSITGTTAPNDYNGVYTITYVSDNTFYILAPGLWNADAGASTWTEGSYLQAGTDAVGTYLVTFSMTAATVVAASKNWKFEVFKNSSEVDHIVAEMTPSGDKHQNCGSTGFATIIAGDRIYLAVKNETDDNNLELEHANLNLHKI